MKRWIRRVLVVLGALVAAAWLFGGHRLLEPKLRAELHASVGVEPTIGFVLLGPDLDIYAYDVRFDDDRFSARVPWAKFEIPLRKLWGSGSTRAVRARRIELTVKSQADLTGLGRGRPEAAAAPPPPTTPPPELFCEDLEVSIEGGGGGFTDVLHVDWFAARPRGARDVRVETGRGRARGLPFDNAEALLVRTRGHLLVSDFKLRTFGGIVDGMLDVHLERAGRFNGELRWNLLEVEDVCRHYGLAYAEKRRGELSGEVRFEAERPRLRSVKGSGTVRVERAHFWSPITFKAFGVLGLPAREESWVHRADASFSMEKALLFVETGLVRGAEYRLDVKGIVDLEGACDLEVEHAGSTLAIRGNLEDPDVVFLPLNAVTVPFDRLYRERLDKRK